MSPSQFLFTAARIALALGRDKRGVLRMLRGVAPAGKAAVAGGQLADVWSVESLPTLYRESLDRLAKARQYRNAEHLLADGFQRWKPSIPLGEVHPRHIDKAAKVKQALARALALHQDGRAGGGEVTRAAHEDYQRLLGPASERNVRRILDRTIERDSGDEDFDHIALYLDDKISRSGSTEKILPGLLKPSEQSVYRYLGSVAQPSAPTIEEQDFIWFTACEAIREEVEAGAKDKACRRAMLAFLEKSGVVLSKNAEALRVLLKRKYARYVECGGDFATMSDKRAEKSGWHRKVELSEETRQLIVGHTAQNHDGRLAPALRELRRDGKLGCEYEMQHTSSPARKSYVPSSLRAEVQRDIRRLKNITRGPREHKLKGAFITRDYSHMAAGSYYSADDCTAPVYWWEETPAGAQIMRGQWLVMHDLRTDYVLGWLLIPERNYDSLSVRSLITICAAKHGLPGKGLLFENGIWRKSKIISGRRDALPWEHFDRGVRNLGISLHHARLPRAKPIERTLGLLQNRMESIPGYVGRNEMTDEYERIQKQLADAKAGRRPCNEVLLSKEQFGRRLADIVEAHNNEPQEGRLNGLSPEEAWKQLQGSEPRQGFDYRWRYVLASDVRKLKIGRNGIALLYGRRTFRYRDAETGKRVGETVLVWFDPMSPEVVTCTDLNRENPFPVERAQELPAMDADPEQFAAEQARIDAHQGYAKTLYWTSQHVLKAHNYRETIPDKATIELGAGITAARERVIAKADESTKRRRANKALVESRNAPRELLSIAPDAPTEAIESISDFLKQKPENTP